MSTPKFEYLTEIDGMKVIMTDHAKAQCKSRHGVNLDQMKTFFNDTAKAWTNYVPAEYNQECFLWSAKWQRGMVVAYRRDFKNQTNKRLGLVVITVYPFGKCRPVQPDTEVIYG